MRTRHWLKLTGMIELFIVFFALTALCASAETEGIFTYTVANDEATVTKVDCSEVKDVVIPETLGGYPVTTLNGGYCFEDNDNIRGNGPDTLFIPKTITSIRSGAFTFSDFKKILVDEENPNYTAVDGVLFTKDMKTLILASGGFASECYYIPEGVETIGNGAFHTCILIEEIVLPSSLRTIQSQAFWSLQNMKAIHLNEGLQSIADNCFVYSNKLETITIPSTVTNIAYGAFTEMSGLKEAVVLGGISTLNRYTFENDTALERVYLPASLTSIGSGVFGNCTALTDICYAGSEEDWANVTINTASYAGSRPVVIDACNIHYNVPIEAYQSLTFENDNDILTFSGSGAIPGGWHYWDAEKDTVTTVIVDGDYTSIDTGAFADYPALTTVLLRTPSTSIADGAFVNCPNLQAVLCFGSSSFGADAFDFDGTLKVYENSDATHSMTASQDTITVVPYRVSDGTLQLLADVSYDSYEFFDTLAAFTLQYDNIQKLSFRRFTFDSIPMYYYPEENGGTRRIEDDTLVNGEMYPMIDVEGEATPITFNTLVNGLADKSISSFYLISSDENHKQIKDTQVTVSDDTDDSGFLGFVRKAMRWVITLLNKLFKIISRLGR